MDKSQVFLCEGSTDGTREGFFRKNIVAVSFFQICAIHPYSQYIPFPLSEIFQAGTSCLFTFTDVQST